MNARKCRIAGLRPQKKTNRPRSYTPSIEPETVDVPSGIPLPRSPTNSLEGSERSLSRAGEDGYHVADRLGAFVFFRLETGTCGEIPMLITFTLPAFVRRRTSSPGVRGHHRTSTGLESGEAPVS